MESVYELDPLTEFFVAIRNKATRRNYEKDLGRFFAFLKLDGTMREQARDFTKKAKTDLQ
ncbi:MAG: hypothetical protein ACYCPW_07565 [Nitrososphaerales archaeon]